jgi:putative ABC transport system permease protein
MNIQLTLAARYLSGRKLRTFLTTLAVTFGVLVLFGMNIVLPTMIEALQANAMAAAGEVDASITQVSGGAFDMQVFKRVQTMEGVRVASATLNRTINLPANFYDQDPAYPDRVSAIALVGITPYDAKAVRSFPISTGRYLEDADRTAALISQSLADVANVQVGGSLAVPSINGVVNLVVVGILPPRTAPGNEEVFVTLAQAQEMTGEPGKINTIDINLASLDETRRNEITASLQTELGDTYSIGAILTGTEMFASLQLGQAMMSLFGILALFMGAFIIFNTFRTIVVERRRDIGMLRALGADQRTILGLILIEGLLQGVIGTAAGILLGYLMGAGIVAAAGPAMSQFINLKLGSPVISPAILVISIVMGVGVTVAAGLLPALNASKISPLEALRPASAEIEFKRQTGRSFVIGVALIALSLLALFSGITAWIGLGAMLFLIGLVMTAPALVRPLARAFGWILAKTASRSGSSDLAQGNLSRQPSRVAITASASMLGLAVVVAAGGMVSSLTLMLPDLLKKSLGSDYLFVPPSIAVWNTDLGSKAEFAETLRGIEGVAAVSTLRFANAAVDRLPISLLGIDPVNFPMVAGLKFSENSLANENAVYEMLARERVMIPNGVFIATYGVKLGDTVELLTPKGLQSYRIIAVASDLLNAKVVTAYISHANLLADFDKSEDVFIQLNLKPGADTAAAGQAIRAAAKAYPQYNVIDGKGYYNSMMAQMNGAFAAMYFILALLALPSLIAMLNTLAIGVIERTREIGMLRAVGSTQKQVHRMVLAEALILAGIGTAFGIAAGLYLGYVFVAALSDIFPLGYAFPLSGIVAAVAIGLVFGALAAIIPARQAARLEIVQALRYE